MAKIIKFKVHSEEDGKLLAIENNKDIPFSIKRVYYIYDTIPDIIRGKHSHKSLEQVLISINGSCKVMMDDGKGNKEIVVLDKRDEGLYIAGNVWREMFDFSDDSVLLVLASDYYNESDYIRDYDKFLASVN